MVVIGGCHLLSCEVIGHLSACPSSLIIQQFVSSLCFHGRHMELNELLCGVNELLHISVVYSGQVCTSVLNWPRLLKFHIPVFSPCAIVR